MGTKRFEVMGKILVKRKKLAEDYNRLSSIFRTSVIIFFFFENWSNAENLNVRF